MGEAGKARRGGQICCPPRALLLWASSLVEWLPVLFEKKLQAKRQEQHEWEGGRMGREL